MSLIKPFLAAALACLAVSACAGGSGTEMPPQQREALADDMLEPNDMTGGYMPGLGIGGV